MDVAMPHRLKQVCQRVLQKRRGWMLVNAAGILRMGSDRCAYVDDWQRTFASPWAGHLTCFRRRWRKFRRSQGRRFRHRSSDARIRRSIVVYAYGASVKRRRKNPAPTVGLSWRAAGCAVMWRRPRFDRHR